MGSVVYIQKNIIFVTLLFMQLTLIIRKMISNNKQADTQSQSQFNSYRTPEIRILEVEAHSVICISPDSGNDSLLEQDFGNGGFTQPEL